MNDNHKMDNSDKLTKFKSYQLDLTPSNLRNQSLMNDESPNFNGHHSPKILMN